MWPSLNLHFQQFRYGFIHDERIQRKHVTENFYVQNEREKKWLHMLRRWNKKDTVEKLKKRVYKGIPNKLRSAVCRILSNNFITRKVNNAILCCRLG